MTPRHPDAAIAATMVGSYPMPSWLGRRTDEPHGVGVVWNLTGDELLAGQRDAILLALHDQETAGLDVVTDGEQSRAGYVTHLTRRLDGFDYQTLGHKWKSGGRRRAEVGRVVGPVRWRQPVMAEDVRYLETHTDRAVKIQLPGPMTIVDSTLDTHYGDERALALDLAAAINAEAHALAAAGCDVIQIDEPAFSRYPERLEAWGIEALDRCLAGLPCATAVHVCYSYPLPGVPRPVVDSYAAILPMLARSSVGALALEFEEPALDPAVLARAGDKAIVFGAISICRDAVEAPAHVASRLEEALRHVAPERLMVAPDCGLLYLSREIARAKLAAMVEGAHIVRRRLGVAGAAR